MDALIEQMLLGAPNLLGFALAAYWLSRKLDRVLDVLLTLLIDKLEQQIPQDDQTLD